MENSVNKKETLSKQVDDRCLKVTVVHSTEYSQIDMLNIPTSLHSIGMGKMPQYLAREILQR